MSPMHTRSDPSAPLDPAAVAGAAGVGAGTGAPSGGQGVGFGSARGMMTPSDDFLNLDSVSNRLQQDSLLQHLSIGGGGGVSGGGGGIINIGRPRNPQEQQQQQQQQQQRHNVNSNKKNSLGIPEARSKADSLLAVTLSKRHALGLCERDIRCSRLHSHSGRCKLSEDPIAALREAESTAAAAAGTGGGAVTAAAGGSGGGDGQPKRRGRLPGRPLGSGGASAGATTQRGTKKKPVCMCGIRVNATRPDPTGPFVYSCTTCGFYWETRTAPANALARITTATAAKIAPQTRPAATNTAPVAVNTHRGPARRSDDFDDDDEATLEDDTDEDTIAESDVDDADEEDAYLAGRFTIRDDGTDDVDDASGRKKSGRVARRRRPSSRLDTDLFDITALFKARKVEKHGGGNHAASGSGDGSLAGETEKKSGGSTHHQHHPHGVGNPSSVSGRTNTTTQDRKVSGLPNSQQQQPRVPLQFATKPPSAAAPTAAGIAPLSLTPPSAGITLEKSANATLSPSLIGSEGLPSSSPTRPGGGRHPPLGPQGCWRSELCTKEYGHRGSCRGEQGLAMRKSVPIPVVAEDEEGGDDGVAADAGVPAVHVQPGAEEIQWQAQGTLVEPGTQIVEIFYFSNTKKN